MSDDLSFRRATPSDYPTLGALSTLAYPVGPDGAEGRAARYRMLDGLFPSERWVVERGGRHVGQYTTFGHEIWLGGVPSPVGGLASIAVAPEARRTGVAAAIVRHHLERQRAAAVPWSLLYAFSPRFYAAHGWAAAASRVRWRFRPSELPLYAERARVESVALARPGQAERVQRVYERWCARVNGSISRTRAQLGFVWGAERVIAVGAPSDDGQLGAYLFAQPRASGTRPQLLTVGEFVATDDAARRALLGFLAAQGDQFDWIELDAPAGDPIGALLDRGVPEREDEEMPEEHQPVATIYAGGMARVVDLPRALAARGWRRPSSPALIAFAADDALVPANANPVTLTVEEAGAKVHPGRAPGAPLVSGPIAALSQILVGGLGVADAVRHGRVAVDPPDAVAAVAALVDLPPPYPLVVF